MLPYTPLHHLLFAAGAPDVLVMTSANRSSEPIAYEDDDARERLAGIADAFLVGERPIARRVDDSVVRVRARSGRSILRRARGYAPGAVATLPVDAADSRARRRSEERDHAGRRRPGVREPAHRRPGALRRAAARFEATIRRSARDVRRRRATSCWWCTTRIPQYRSTRSRRARRRAEHAAVQHHRAHVASVLAERGAWDQRVLGVSLDGTGYGDDGTIWGGEIFAGSVREGFERVAHLRPAALAGGDAAARHPVQAAAGFLAQLDGLPDLAAAPFEFPAALRRRRAGCSRPASASFPTTSMGRLFDTAAALLGFTRPVTFEGQAAIWLEQLAARVAAGGAVSVSVRRRRARLPPAAPRRRRRPPAGPRPRARSPARSIGGLARGLRDAAVALCARARARHGGARRAACSRTSCCSTSWRPLLERQRLTLWTNHARPAERRRHQPRTGRARRAGDHARALDRDEHRRPGPGGGRPAGRARLRACIVRLGALAGVVKEALLVVVRDGVRGRLRSRDRGW